MTQSNGNKWRALLVAVSVVGVLALALFGLISVSAAAPPPPVTGDPVGPEGAVRPLPLSPQGKSTLGDYVWWDPTLDGAHTGAEAEWGSYGIDGVTVTLYLDANTDGIPDPGEYVTTTVTGDNPATTGVTEEGWYDFDVTAGGNIYIVVIEDSNFDPGGPLENYVLTSEPTFGDEPMVVYLPGLIEDYNDADFGYALAGVQIVKVAGDAADGEVEFIPTPGGTVYYTYTVTNTGETYLSSIIITDDNGTAGTGDDFQVCSVAGPLGPGLSTECYWNGPVTDDRTNVATVVANPTDIGGTDFPGGDATDDDDAVVEVVDASMELLKLAGTAADGDIFYIDAAGNVTYTYIVTNTSVTAYLSDIEIVDDQGTVSTGDDITITDTLCSGLAGPLAPGNSVTCQIQVLVSDYYHNVADVTANPTNSGGGDLPGVPDTSATDDAEADVYGSIGDYVWDDTNGDGIQNEGGTTGIPGVTVNLYDSGDNFVGTTTTDANGIYTLTQVMATTTWSSSRLPATSSRRRMWGAMTPSTVTPTPPQARRSSPRLTPVRTTSPGTQACTNRPA